MNFGFSVGRRTADGRKDWKRYSDASIVVGEEETEVLKEEARKLGVYVSIGISERDAVNGTLYNSNLLISPDGEVLTHRKLKPTGSGVWSGAMRMRIFPCDGYALGADRLPDLLGELHASCKDGAVSEGDYDLYFLQYE